MRTEAANFVAKLRAHMKKPPKDHADHFYWVSGVQAWASLKFPGEPPTLPPEISSETRRGPSRAVRPRSRLVRSYIDLLGFMRRLNDVIPNVPVWHHLWLDSHLILKWVDAVKVRPKKPCLLICSETSPLPASLGKHIPLDVRTGFGELLESFADQPQGGDLASDAHPPFLTYERYDYVLIHIFRAELLKLRSVVEYAKSYVTPDGTISIYIEHKDGELDPSNFAFELAQYVDELLPFDWLAYRMKTGFAGGRVKRQLRLIERFLLRNLWPASPWRLPHLIVSAALWPLMAALTALNNLRLRNASSTCPEYCSSALLSLTRISLPAATERSPPMELKTG
jgi:hypothetical protein